MFDGQIGRTLFVKRAGPSMIYIIFKLVEIILAIRGAIVPLSFRDGNSPC